MAGYGGSNLPATAFKYADDVAMSLRGFLEWQPDSVEVEPGSNGGAGSSGSAPRSGPGGGDGNDNVSVKRRRKAGTREVKRFDTLFVPLPTS